jgi:flagellar protein FlbD
MIQVTRINHVPLVLNADLIEHIETTPDTVISLTNGQKFIVLESADEIIQSVIAFRRRIAAPHWTTTFARPALPAASARLSPPPDVDAQPVDESSLAVRNSTCSIR